MSTSRDLLEYACNGMLELKHFEPAPPHHIDLISAVCGHFHWPLRAIFLPIGEPTCLDIDLKMILKIRGGVTFKLSASVSAQFYFLV